MARSKTVALASSGNMRIGNSHFDIVECALRNDFAGVDRALEGQPEMINAQRKSSGITALMAASGRRLERMVDHLLAKPGIDLFIRDDFGKSAFEHARLWPEITGQLMIARHPSLEGRWKEPKIDIA